MTTSRKNQPPKTVTFNPDPLGDNLDDSPVGEAPDSESQEYDYGEFEAVTVPSMAQEKAPEPIVEKPERKAKPEAKSGPPTLQEWQDFIGRFVIRGLTEAYLNVALSDFYDDLTPHERETIRLTKEDLKEMSAPLASMAHKSTFLRKRGRSIIASADSGEAIVALLIWMRRVNRIAKKYRKSRMPSAPQTMPGYVVEDSNGNNGSNVGQGPDAGPQGFGIWNPGTG
jgi:hypothetical protein